MKLNPAPTKALSSSIDRFSSIVQPKTFPPKQSGDTFRPERPSIRSSIPALLMCGYFGSLTLQLPFCFEVRALSNRLVSSTPERPCDDVCGLNPLSSESDGDAAVFLALPTA